MISRITFAMAVRLLYGALAQEYPSLVRQGGAFAPVLCSWPKRQTCLVSGERRFR
jgi:hypothetical protein